MLDARYRYEFEGGHIQGAENFGMWDEQKFMDEFFPESLGPKALAIPPNGSDSANKNEGGDPHSILIFHCEFSSARGPALLRALRKRLV